MAKDPFDTESLNNFINEAVRRGTSTIMAIEYALWDIKGTALGCACLSTAGLQVHAE